MVIGYFLAALTGIFLLGMAALVAWSPSLDSLPMQSVGYTWIAVFYGLVIMSALAQPAWPIAVIARVRWLARNRARLVLSIPDSRCGAYRRSLFAANVCVRMRRHGNSLPPTLWQLSSLILLRGCLGFTSNIRFFAAATNLSIELSRRVGAALTWAKAGT